MFEHYMKNGFHESYYDHACRVVTERDILDIHFKETSLLGCLKKKWYDLFLLWHSDERAGSFYRSTHAMRMGRAQHFLRNFWDFFIAHVFIVHLLIMYMNTTVILPNVPISICYFGVILEVVIILDIFVNTRTGFVDILSRTVELDQRTIFINYCSRKIFFHAASSIPMIFVMFLRYGNMITCTICKANHFNCVMSFLTIINLFRVYELSSCWKQDRKTCFPKGISHFRRIGVNIILTTIQLIHYSDTISIIHIMEFGNWSSHSMEGKSVFDNYFYLIHLKPTNQTNLDFISGQLLRVVNFLAQPRFVWMNRSSDSYSILYPHPLIRIIAYLMICISCGWLVLEIFNYLVRVRYFNDEIYKGERYISKLVVTRQLPDDFHAQLKTYCYFPPTKAKVMEAKNSLNKALPQNLKDEIAWQSFSRYIQRIPYFSTWPKEVVKKIVFMIEEHVFLENDVVVEAGISGQGLMIVDAGMLAVFKVQPSQCTEVEHLIDGDYFGQLSLVTDNEVSAYSVVAVTITKILLVEKNLFRYLMRSWPDLFYSFRKELEREEISQNSQVGHTAS